MTILRSLLLVALLGSAAYADPVEDQIKAIPGVSALGTVRFSTMNTGYKLAIQDPQLRATGYAFTSSLDPARPGTSRSRPREGVRSRASSPSAKRSRTSSW